MAYRYFIQDYRRWEAKDSGDDLDKEIMFLEAVPRHTQFKPCKTTIRKSNYV
jgi:hypothetical protein